MCYSLSEHEINTYKIQCRFLYVKQLIRNIFINNNELPTRTESTQVYN